MRENIIETSLQQFLQHGIKKMTVKELVSPLGISTKTVYKYFADKETLLEECVELHYSRIHVGMLQVSQHNSNPLLFIFQLFIRGMELDFTINALFYQDLNYYYPDLQDKVIKSNSEKFYEPIAAAFKSGIEQGYILDCVNPAVILEGLGVFYRALTRSALFQKFDLSPFELAANTIELYLRGVCTEKGLSIIEANRNLTSFNKNTAS